MEPDGCSWRAVAEGVLEQVGQDFCHGAAVSAPAGHAGRRVPGPSLEGRGGSRPLQQGLEPLPQRFAFGPDQGGRQQKQGLGGLARDRRGVRGAQSAEGIDVAVELALLRQQALDQRPVLAVLVEAAQEELAKGAKRRQGIAQLVQQDVELGLLPSEGLLQLLLFQIQAEGFGQAEGNGLQSLAEAFRPGHRKGFHLDGSKQHVLVAQRQPAAFFGRGPQGAVCFHGRQDAAGAGPLANGHQAWPPAIAWLGANTRLSHVDNDGVHITPVGKLGQLKAQQG